MDELEKLYSVLLEQKLYTKSFDEFKAKYDGNAENQAFLFSVVKDNQLYTKSQDEFVGKYFGGVKKKESSQQKNETTPSQSADIPLVTLSDKEVGISESVTVPNQSEVKPQVNAPFTGEIPIAPKQNYTPKNLRPLTDNDFYKAQEQGIAPPDSELRKSQSKEEIYDMDMSGKPLEKKVETPNFYDTAGNLDQTEFVEKTKQDIFNKASEKDLNLTDPYLYFYNQQETKDDFVNSIYGEEKIKELGINPQDFEGFLIKKGLKADYQDKLERGLFDNESVNFRGQKVGALGKDVEKYKLLSLYMQDKDDRMRDASVLSQGIENPTAYVHNEIKRPNDITQFSSEKVENFIKTETPVLYEVSKKVDEKNSEILRKHKNGEAGFFYGAGKMANSGFNALVDRATGFAATGYDFIGADDTADELRMLLGTDKISRPNTREIVSVSGKVIDNNGEKYIVDSKGDVYDVEKKIRITDTFIFPGHLKSIRNKAKESNQTDWIFSPQGALIQATGVATDLLFQIALTRGVSGAVGAGLRGASLAGEIGAFGTTTGIRTLGAIENLGGSAIAQSAMGYSSGLEDALEVAQEQGMTREDANRLSNDIATQMAILYGWTSFISPQTTAVKSIFGGGQKEIIKKAFIEFAKGGEKAYQKSLSESFKQITNKIAKGAVEFTEEGGKEVVQENIQQYAETKQINPLINQGVGANVRQTEMTKDDYINTSILSFFSSGLMSQMKMPVWYNGNASDRLLMIKKLSEDTNEFNNALTPLIEQGGVTQEFADELKRDVSNFKKQANNIPQDLDTEVALAVMDDLQSIEDLKEKKKNLHPTFQTQYNEQIEQKNESLNKKLEFSKLSKEQKLQAKEQASIELVQEMKDSGIEEPMLTDRQITERAVQNTELKESENTTRQGDFFDINNVRERDAETNTNVFNPQESEGEALARLSEQLEGLEGAERETKAEEIAKAHTDSYFEYLNTQENAEELLNSDFAKNFEEITKQALIEGDKVDSTQPKTQENGSRVNEDGDVISETEFLEEQGKIKPIEDEVSPTIELDVNTEPIIANTEAETTNTQPQLEEKDPSRINTNIDKKTSHVKGTLTRVQTIDGLQAIDGNVVKVNDPYKTKSSTESLDVNRNTTHWSTASMRESAGGDWSSSTIGFVANHSDLVNENGDTINAEPSDTYFYGENFVIPKTTKVFTTDIEAFNMFKENGYEVELVEGNSEQLFDRIDRESTDTRLTNEQFKEINDITTGAVTGTDFDTSSKHHANTLFAEIEKKSATKEDRNKYNLNIFRGLLDIIIKADKVAGVKINTIEELKEYAKNEINNSDKISDMRIGHLLTLPSNVVKTELNKALRLFPKEADYYNRISQSKTENVSNAYDLINELLGKSEPNTQKPTQLEINTSEVIDVIELNPDAIENIASFIGKFNLKGVNKFFHASSRKRKGRLSPSNAPQFGTGVYLSTNKDLVVYEFGKEVTSVALNITNPVTTNTKQWRAVEELALEKANEGKIADEDGYIEGEETDIADIKSSFISEAAKDLGYDAIIDEDSMAYENEIVVLDESKIIYNEDLSKIIIKEYRKAKSDGNNPKLVKAVEESIIQNKPKLEEKTNQQPQAVSESEGQTTQVAETVEQPTTERTLTETQKKQNSLVDSRNRYNKFSDAKKRSKEGQNLKMNVIQLASDLGFKVGEKNNKLSVTTDRGTEAGKISFKEQIPNAEQADIDFATSEIESGVLNWDGNPGTPRIDLGMDRQDVRKGEKDILRGKPNTVPAKRLIQALKEARENGVYEYFQGSGGEINRMQVPIAEASKIDNELTSEELEIFNTQQEQEALQYDEWFNTLDEKTKTEILDDYENNPRTISENEQSRESQTNDNNEKKPKTKAERIKASNASVDDIVNAIKGFDEIFGIKLKIDDIDGIKKNGVNMVDAIASVVKKALEAGIEIDVAIQKAIEHFKKTLDFDVDINDIKAKVNPPRNTPNDFQRKQGKKSVFNRIYEGETEQNLKDSVQSNGLDYKVESQEKAQAQAKKFVEQVGVTKALEAVQDNLIKGAEKAFVYAEILDRLTQASENASIEELNRIQNDYNNILDKALVAFDEEARDAGRFISALNKIYQTSRIKYSLAKQVADYKAKNNGEISEEVLTKFKEADKKIKELESKVKALEDERAKKAGNQAIQNIKNANDRGKGTKKTPPPTIKAQAKKIANNIRQAKIHKPNIFSSATPATLVWDSAVEITAKAIEAGGTIADAIKKGSEYIRSTDWFKSLSKTDQKEALNAFNNSMVDSSKGKEITLSYDGEIKIPESLITQLVENGIEDINELSEAILEIIKQDDPNTKLTVREIRDAITKYGKTVNPSQDEIKQKIAEMKRVGRLLSALEDVVGGNRPKKSGFQRPKPTQSERELTSLINDKMKDLPVDEADLEIAWKNALDKLKTRYKNRIEDLQKQIDKQERTKLEKTPTKLDDEATDLKTQINVLKTELDEIVGKETLTDEQKIKRTETALENSIKQLEDQIADGNIEFKEKPEAVTSQRIEQLREARKTLKDELTDLRKDAGIIEKRRIEAKKKSVKNAIEEYKRKLREEDFSKEKREPVKEDNELKELLAEKIRWQEVYDREVYNLELKNRSARLKLKDFLIGVLNIPRILMAGGEMSMVLIQGGVQTVSLATRNPIALAKVFGKAFMAVGSNRKSEEYSTLIKADPHYDIMKKSKLALTEADYKMEMREEEFIGNNLVYGLWNMIGKGLEYGSEKVFGIKNVPSIASTLLSTIKKDVAKDKVSISERFKNMNPLLALERGNTVYMNELRRARFLDGVKMLEMEGKNETDQFEDYRKLARTINSLTGRAELTWKVGDRAVSLEGVNDILNTIFFSFKNTIAVFNQLNPVFYMMQHSPNDPIYKPSVAQKIAVRDMISFVTVTTAFMYLMQAVAGWDDEDDEPIIGIDTDPRSTGFMQMKIKGKEKNIFFDPWHGMKPQVVFLARLIDGNQINSKGKINRIGEGFKNDTHWDNLMTTYVENKFSPSMGMVYRYMDSEVKTENGEEFRYRYGQPLSETFPENFYPMFLNSIIEIEEEDPEFIERFLGALGAFGLNSQVYGESNPKFKKVKKATKKVKKKKKKE